MEWDSVNLGGGLKATLYVATDLRTSLYMALAIFLGMTVALTIYAKLLK